MLQWALGWRPRRRWLGWTPVGRWFPGTWYEGSGALVPHLAADSASLEVSCEKGQEKLPVLGLDCPQYPLPVSCPTRRKDRGAPSGGQVHSLPSEKEDKERKASGLMSCQQNRL